MFADACRLFARVGITCREDSRVSGGVFSGIHTVYDVDLGLPTGPLATSQTVTFVDGAFASVEVIFDAAKIAGVAA